MIIPNPELRACFGIVPIQRSNLLDLALREKYVMVASSHAMRMKKVARKSTNPSR